MHILGIYNQHDACAAVFDDYRMVAAVAQERPTRRKGDGGGFPRAAVAECLEEAGIGLADVDVVCLPRTRFPKEYFKLRAHLPFPQTAKNGTLELIRVMVRNFIADPASAFDAAGIWRRRSCTRKRSISTTTIWRTRLACCSTRAGTRR